MNRRVVGRIYGMEYSWKGHKDKNRNIEQNKKEWASSVEGEPAGTNGMQA